MRNYFTFDSVDSRTYGVYISGSGVFNAPERAVDFISVPGRNGALVGTEKRLENIDVTYPAYIYASTDSNLSSLKSILLSRTSYKRLEDSYHTDEFRKAVFVGEFDVEPDKNLRAAQFDITFNCKPQRWLKSGEATTTITTTGTTISNPTLFASQPMITVTGYGDMYIGSQKITIQQMYTSVVIDSEVGDCYSGLNNANPYITFQTDEFPVLEPGSNSITFDNTITKVEIIPRWWKV